MTTEQIEKSTRKTSSKPRKEALAPLASHRTPANAAPKDAPAFQAYLSFLSLVARASPDQPAALGDIDPNETALLEIVLLNWARGAPMTVRQTIAMAHLGSPATLHKRLMRLRAKQYLQLQDVAGDRRVKQLVSGPRGMDYAETMGRFLPNARQVIKKASTRGSVAAAPSAPAA